MKTAAALSGGAVKLTTGTLDGSTASCARASWRATAEEEVEGRLRR